MFRKICAFIVFVGFLNVSWAATQIPQVITSEVFYDSGVQNDEYVAEEVEYTEPIEPIIRRDVPAWPEIGSEADVEIACGDTGCSDNNPKIVTKVGTGLVIENNIITHGNGWSGGPNIENGYQIPAGFDNECENNSEMPLLRREMLEDDGGSVLAVSRSARKKCSKRADSYAVFAERAGFSAEKTCDKDMSVDNSEIAVSTSGNEYTDEEAPAMMRDQVRSWVVASGQTLRQVLQSWCDQEGWDLVWTTSREYPIEASAVFKGRFVDVASALIRNFERATPIPYAKFYKGNRVIVVSTSEE